MNRKLPIINSKLIPVNLCDFSRIGKMYLLICELRNHIYFIANVESET